MDDKSLDRERIEAITRFVEANRDRLHEGFKALTVDGDGDPLPCIVLLPTGAGVHVMANMPTATVAGILRAAAVTFEREAFAKAFAKSLGDSLDRVLTNVRLVPADEAEDEDDGEAGGSKVH